MLQRFPPMPFVVRVRAGPYLLFSTAGVPGVAPLGDQPNEGPNHRPFSRCGSSTIWNLCVRGPTSDFKPSQVCARLPATRGLHQSFMRAREHSQERTNVSACNVLCCVLSFMQLICFVVIHVVIGGRRLHILCTSLVFLLAAQSRDKRRCVLALNMQRTCG